MAKRKIRTSQLVTPFGVGQIINFPNNESLMVGGLNLWEEKFRMAGDPSNYELTRFQITEKRLQSLLNVTHLRSPFPFLTSSVLNKEISMPAVRFPRWHYCLKCGRMRKINLIQADYNCLKDGCNGQLIPVRFVAACRQSQSHIQDVPFLEWVHRGNNYTDDCVLTYDGRTGAGDLSSIVIRCSCSRWRTLAGIMHDHALASIGLESGEELDNGNANGQYCRGERPWLGLNGVQSPVSCGKELKVMIRGASNVHYSHIASAIYLPIGEGISPETTKVIDDIGVTKLLTFYNQDNGKGDVLRLMLSIRTEVTNGKIELDLLYSEIVSKLNNKEAEGQEQTEINELQIKFEEYGVFNKGYNKEGIDLKAILSDFSRYDEKEFLGKYFEHITLVEKLMETRVFTGFSRIDANDGRTLEERKADLSTEHVSWLPAMQVYGEGIFLKFKDDVIDAWLNETNTAFDKLLNRYKQARDRQNVERNVNPAFIMMHTFAHLLIKRLCFSCGYGSSSLRERIYFSSDPETRMNGILIYTSSGDSEGSMGGLVRQGKPSYLSKNIIDALLDAEWCSADPVCSDIGKSVGQGPDSVNGAACHNCVIVPETSCEEYNSLLDRSAVITLNNSVVKGFFKVDEI